MAIILRIELNWRFSAIDQIRKAVLPSLLFLHDLIGRREIRNPTQVRHGSPRSKSDHRRESGEDYNIIDVLLVTSLDFKRGSKSKTTGGLTASSDTLTGQIRQSR
jgi:hypothetical protein